MYPAAWSMSWPVKTMLLKNAFKEALAVLASTLSDYASTDAGEWTIKGFIDTYREVYTISSDTKVVSKILEIHLFPKILAFAQEQEFEVILADHQNYYPDNSFVSKTDENVKFAAEKWRISSDKRGSGNTANIGSIQRIADIVSGNGMFAKLGEEWFDDYWMNYSKITIKTQSGETKRITSLEEFVTYRGGVTSLIVPRNNSE